MGIIKKFSILGWHFGGAEVVIDKKVTMQDIGNALFDSSNGTVLWYIKTAIVNSFRIRDNTKAIDFLVIDTDDEIAYTVTPVKQIVFADSPYAAIWGQDLEVNTTAGAVTINLPTAVGANGKQVTVTVVDATNNVTVDGSTTETINGSLTQVLTTLWTSVVFKSNNTNIGIR